MTHIEPTREQGPLVDGPLQLDVRGGEVEVGGGEELTRNCKDDIWQIFKLRSNAYGPRYYPLPSLSLMGLV
jgi:hypothetical protein